VVYLNLKPKTKDDVFSYIRKSSDGLEDKSREGLLEFLDTKRTRQHITWRHADSPPEDETGQISSTEVDSSPTFRGKQEPSSGSYQDAGFVKLDDPSTEVMSVDSSDDTGPEEIEIQPPEPQELEMQDLYARPDLQPPRDTMPDAVAQSVDPRKMNGLMSNSPLQSNLSLQALSDRVTEMFGTIDAIGKDIHSRARVAMFLRHACAATIYSGQGYQQQRWDSIRQATNIFQDIILNNAWDTITTLNNMFALLSMYGHRILVQDLLKAAYDQTERCACLDGLSEVTSVLRIVINFMMSIPDPGEKPAYDLASLAHMEALASTCFPDHPEFHLSAVYCHAWVLLEMKQQPEALQKLLNHRADCEEVFDYGQFQTICWLATLARAYARNKKYKVAANTYRDVAGRIQKYFSPSHPQYWDSIYRQACFDRYVHERNEDEHAKREGRLQVARTLQSTLRWRMEVLGGYNPLTLQNHRALLSVLKKLGKTDGSLTLANAVDMALS
jgi:hypothetical protein